MRGFDLERVAVISDSLVRIPTSSSASGGRVLTLIASLNLPSLSGGRKEQLRRFAVVVNAASIQNARRSDPMHDRLQTGKAVACQKRLSSGNLAVLGHST
jgi:hypothetical protein